ncbi:MAG: ADP-ribosylglycohydrolase family protein [Planctomyces sp.]|nr:ADP-ribosylglycohydrolase family protein [Planctomyces sp.]
MTEDQIVGCILGTAVGDAIGLPYEGLSRRRASRLLGSPDRHRFFFGRGMVSDDTEHTCIVAQALICSDGDIHRFQHSLAWGLRRWLLGIPAGIGVATLRSILRMWIGFSPEHSGVFSAGNGPAMRAAVLGVVLGDSTLRDFVRASSRMTHTDPKAELGAFAVALAAQLAAQKTKVTPECYLDHLESKIRNDDPEFLRLISKVVVSVNAGQTTEAFVDAIGLKTGVSGYIYHSVPVAIHAWLSNQEDCRKAIEAVVRCGGDTDTTGAIVGGIVGAAVGRSGIPEDWLSTLVEWPRTVEWMEKLGKQLATIGTPNSNCRPMRLPIFRQLSRNLFFLVVVLYHGFRRLVPPY